MRRRERDCRVCSCWGLAQRSFLRKEARTGGVASVRAVRMWSAFGRDCGSC